MYKTAHRWFAIGVCSLLSFLFGFTIASVLLLAVVGYVLGPLPDMDQKLPFFSHRGFSHKPTFAFFVTVPIGTLVVYVGWLVNFVSSQSMFTTSMVDVDGIPVSKMFLAFLKGDLLAVVIDPSFLTYLVVFIAIFTHIVLDIITPSGLELFGRKISGGILSDDPQTNKLLTLVGIFLFVVAIALSILSAFADVSLYGTLTVFFLISTTTIVFFASASKKKKRVLDQYKCYDINGEQFCTKKSCVLIKGKKVCVNEKSD